MIVGFQLVAPESKFIFHNQLENANNNNPLILIILNPFNFTIKLDKTKVKIEKFMQTHPQVS